MKLLRGADLQHYNLENPHIFRWESPEDGGLCHLPQLLLLLVATLLKALYMPGTVLSPLHTLSYPILTRAQWNQHHYDSHPFSSGS